MLSNISPGSRESGVVAFFLNEFIAGDSFENFFDKLTTTFEDRIGDTTGNSQMVDSVDQALSYFEHAKDTKHDVLRKYSGMALQRSYEAAANLKDAEIVRAQGDFEIVVV